MALAPLGFVAVVAILAILYTYRYKLLKLVGVTK